MVAIENMRAALPPPSKNKAGIFSKPARKKEATFIAILATKALAVLCFNIQWTTGYSMASPTGITHHVWRRMSVEKNIACQTGVCNGKCV